MHETRTPASLVVEQVLVYPRDDSTGELSKFTELSALDGEDFTEGTVAGFVLSSDTLFMNIAVEKSGKGGIALYDANVSVLVAGLGVDFKYFTTNGMFLHHPKLSYS